MALIAAVPTLCGTASVNLSLMLELCQLQLHDLDLNFAQGLRVLGWNERWHWRRMFHGTTTPWKTIPRISFTLHAVRRTDRLRGLQSHSIVIAACTGLTDVSHTADLTNASHPRHGLIQFTFQNTQAHTHNSPYTVKGCTFEKHDQIGISLTSKWPSNPTPHAHRSLTDRQTALMRDGSNQVSHLAPWARVEERRVHGQISSGRIRCCKRCFRKERRVQSLCHRQKSRRESRIVKCSSCGKQNSEGAAFFGCAQIL